MSNCGLLFLGQHGSDGRLRQTVDDGVQQPGPDPGNCVHMMGAAGEPHELFNISFSYKYMQSSGLFITEVEFHSSFSLVLLR